MIQKDVMAVMLKCLEQHAGTPVGERNLHNDMNMEATQAITSSQTLEHIQYAYDKGWIDYRLGALRDKRWFILDSGKQARRDLEID